MTVNIPTHYTDQYSDNVAHLLQKKGGVYRQYIEEMPCTGEQAVMVNQYGEAAMSEVTDRFQAMGRNDPTTQRVWLHPRSFDVNHMVDTFDKLKIELTDPDSELAKAAVKAAKRTIDEVVRDAFFGDMSIGQRGGSTQSFDTTNHRIDAAVGAASDTGLNVEKIIEAVTLLENNDVDLEDPENEVCMAITPNLHLDMLNQTKVINGDYFTNGGRSVLEEGKIKQFMGVKIVRTRIVPTNSSYTLVPMWVKSGMKLGIWSDIKAYADPRPDLRGRPLQTYTTMSINATRLEAGRVIQIECTES